MCLLIFFLIIQKEFSKRVPLSYIPFEFENLKKEALSSARKRIKEINNDDPIVPNKPYIKDTFIGYVNNAFFAQTVSDLKGFSISNEYEHMAIIVDRKTANGKQMLKEKSMFADEKTNSVYSLHEKVADDGEVAIYKMAKIDDFQIFDRFKLTLPKSSDFDFKCVDAGINFGGRCWADASYNYDEIKDMPKNKTIKKSIFNINAYYGVKGRAEVSLVVKKNGEFHLQAELDSSLDLSGGIGFSIPKFNYTITNEEILKEYKKKIITKKFKIFTFDLNIGVYFVSQPKIDIFQAMITQPITLIKKFKIHLRKSVTVSSKHKETNDNEKEFHMESIQEDGGYDYSTKLIKESFIKGNFSVKAGIRVEIGILKTDLSIEAGIKPMFNFSFTRNTTKCTAPSMYGTFIPSIYSYLNVTGEIKIGFIKLLKRSKEKLMKIISFDGLFGNCLYNDDVSTELDKSLIDLNRSSLNLLKFHNFQASKNGLYSIVNNLSNSDRFYNKYLFVDKENDHFHPPEAFIITRENHNFTKIKSYIKYENDPSEKNETDSLIISSNDFHFNSNVHLNKNEFNYTLDAHKSRPVLYGKEFTINNSEYINSRPFGISEFPFNLGLIYKVNKSYHAHYNDYIVINEYEDALHKDSENDKLYKATDYSAFNISIELNDPKLTEYCFQRQSLKVFHTHGENENHLLYTTFFECNNNAINQLFHSSHIYVPLSESKGYKNCVSIVFGNDTINLTRNDLINPNDVIIKKFDIFTYKIHVFYPGFPEYIFQLKNIQNSPTKGIVARFFQFKNNNIFEFDGVPQTTHFIMAENEVYGIYRGLFVWHGENLSNTYALIYMPKMQPLTNEAKSVEYDTYFIKLIVNSNLFKRYPNNLNDNSYDIIIPFRRRSFNRDNRLNITLLMIFQAEESSQNDPYCSLFPKFNLKPNKNFYVGCIHNISSNSWEHFTSIDSNLIREHEINIPNSQYKLHCINLKKTPKNNFDDIMIHATMKYIRFPLTSRYMIVDANTAKLLSSYCYGDYLQVICERCNKIMIEKNNEIVPMLHTPNLDDVFRIMIDESYNSSFSLIAYCESNESAHCTFELDLADDGFVLVEYNSEYKTSSGSLDDDLPNALPGVEEIFDNNTNFDDHPNQICLDSGFKRQIIYRKDKIIATKPWGGPIKKIIQNMETKRLVLNVTYRTVFNDYYELSIHDQNGIDIPFDPKAFIQVINNNSSDVLLQLGINYDFNKTDAKNYINMNSDGHIVIKKTMFNENEITKISKIEKFELVGLPEGSFKIVYGGSEDIIEINWFLDNLIYIVEILFITFCMACLIAVCIVWSKCGKHCRCCKYKNRSTLNDNVL